jgi:CRP/FNR family cyclic AMP-dependent transcriptional regulator
MPAMLHNIHILAGLDEAALHLLWDRALESKASAGSLIVREGEDGNRLFLVAEGLVRVCRHFAQPDESELARFGPGDFFGEMCILETLPRSATVQAVDDTTLYSLNSLTFYDLYEAMPRQHSILLLNIARDLSRRLRHLDDIFAAKH